MKILMISKDASVLTPGTGAYKRMEEYRTLAGDLRIISLDARGLKLDPKGFKGWRPELVTAQDPFETGFLALVAATFFGARLQLQLHTDFLSPYFKNTTLNRIRVFLARFTLPRASCIRVVSERIRQSLSSIDPSLPKRTTVLPIWADKAALESAPLDRDLRALYPQFEKRILMASRLEPEKDIASALVAFSRVLKQFPKTGLIVVGAGGELERLKGIVSDLGIGESVVFESWSNSLASYYKSADLFLQCSLFEGYGLSLIEAAVCGVPIATSEVGVVGYELARESVFSFEPRDLAGIEAALQQALSGEKRIPVIFQKLLTREENAEAMRHAWLSC